LNGGRKYKAWLSLPFDLAMVPIAIGYYFFGRFFLAKTLIATNACDNCGLCVNQCPVSAIKESIRKPFWTYKCESCMRCINNCPRRAIETAHGFAGLILVLIYALIFPFLMVVLNRYDILDKTVTYFIPDLVFSIVKTLLFLLIFFLSYRLLHFAMKNKMINRVIAYSSLSKFRFWRRYKAPNKIISR
jgi:Pyruvate/2-oxoacid:ferredoxin oxidoreductase delta subunit